jgi:iron(III) transport system substrate-binding protein
VTSIPRLVALSLAVVLAGCGGESPPPSEPEPAPADAQDIDAPSGPLTVAAASAGRALADVADAWYAETGSRIRLVDIATPEREEADLVIFDSVADAWDDAEQDGLRPVYSAIVDASVDSTLQDSESRWVALATRARVVVYHEPSVSSEDLASITGYASLGDERWLGRLCLSRSQQGGNQMLVAFLIDELGVREAELAVRRWRDNLATRLFVDDDALLAAIATGECTVGIAGSNRAAAAPATSDIAALWFESQAAIVFDATVAGVTRHAHDADAAQRFLEWLTTPTPNALLAMPRLDFPVNAEAPVAQALTDLPVDPGTVATPLSDLAFLLEESARLRERARYP